MLLEQRLIQPFTKTKYLSEANYKRYTAIIHFLYQQHEIYYAPPALPNLIMEHIRETDHSEMFSAYTEKEMEYDLNQLEEWGNVVSHQDTSNVKSIADFNNRKLRYQCTPDTIKIERLLESMGSQISRVNSSLDPSRIHSLASIILRLESYNGKRELTKADRAELSQLWKQIFEQFDKLREESSDYLGVIHSKNIEDVMQSREITAFRIKFTDYLTGFIIALQKNVHVVEHGIKGVDTEILEYILSELIEHQREIPSLEEPLGDDELRSIFQNQWDALKKWFVYDAEQERYIDYLIQQTNDTITIFTKYLQRINERGQMVRNRKRNFEHIADLFKNEQDFELCQKSFGAMTNIESPPHIFSQEEREVNAEKKLIEHRPELKEVQPMKDRIKKDRRTLAALEPTLEDLIELEILQQKREYEEGVLEKLVAQGTVRLRELRDVQPFVRKALLQWISRTIDKEKKIGKNEQGVTYGVVLESEEWIELKCVDGSLTMPDFGLYFDEVKV